MIINHNMVAMNAHRQMYGTISSQGKSTEKLSSGKRINRGADDAAGLSISEKMRGQIRGLNQAVRNAQDGISFIQTAEGALDEVSNMLVRMKELNVQKASGTYAAADKTAIDTELTQLGTEITRIQGNTDFNGIDVFGGAIGVAIDDSGTTENFGVTFADPSVGSATTIGGIETAIGNVNTARSTLGAHQNRLESIVKNVSNVAENIQAAESRIRDVDMAKEMMNFTKNGILLQASQSMLAQANQLPQGVLSLLR